MCLLVLFRLWVPSLSLSLILVLVYLWKKTQIAVAGAVEIPHPGLVIVSSGVL